MFTYSIILNKKELVSVYYKIIKNNLVELVLKISSNLYIYSIRNNDEIKLLFKK